MGRRGKSKKTAASDNNPAPASNSREPKIADDVADSDDEEIEEDEAFNSEDERMYGHFFENQGTKGGDDGEEEVTSDEDDDGDDDQEEEDDDDGGQYMLDLLDKLDSTKNKGGDGSDVASMAHIPESEYSSSISKKGLTLDNLMEGLQDTQGFKDLQKTFAKKQQATPAPLGKVKADRTQRKLAYQGQIQEISRWTEVVQENRKAETLDFKPKQRLELTRDTLVDKFEPTTDFEKELHEALEEAGQQDEQAVLQAEEQALQDDLGANRLSLEEYKKRRGQLAQIRALMFYHEQKRHHMKKIKSKTYRRIRKKQRERLKDSAIEAAAEDDDELAKELQEKEEVARIQERMTLAHKNTSKWAKRILKRGKNVDKESRRALSAQIKRGDDLRKKMMGDGDDDDDDDSDEDLVESARKVLAETEGAPEANPGKTGLFALSFMQKGIQKQREQAKEEARRLLNELESNAMDDYDEAVKDDFEDDAPKKKEKIASEKEMKKVLQKGELVATSLEFGNSNSVAMSGGIEIDISVTGKKDKVDGNDEADKVVTGTSEHVTTMVRGASTPTKEGISKENGKSSTGKKRKQAKQAPTETKAGEDEANPWMQSTDSPEDDKAVSSTKKKKKNSKGMVDVEGAVDILDAGKRDKVSDLATADNAADGGDSAGKKLTMLTQEELVRRAFAAPSEKQVDEEFQKEKDDIAAEDDPTRKKAKEQAAKQVTGWGSWTGTGAPPPKPRRLPKKLQAPNKKADPKRKRKDDRKPDLIINQKRIKKMANTFMLGDVPHPYSSRSEYEQSMVGGVGKEWNVTNSYKSMTRPEIMTRPGKMIQPISKKAKVARSAAKF